MITGLLSSKVRVGSVSHRVWRPVIVLLCHMSTTWKGYLPTWRATPAISFYLSSHHQSNKSHAKWPQTACGCGQGFECAKSLLHFHHVFIFSFSFSQIFLACLYRVHLFVYWRATYCHLLGNVHIFIKIMVRKCSVTICKTINNMILIF